MSYVDEVINQVVKQNPAEPEFHQAVKTMMHEQSIYYVCDHIFAPDGQQNNQLYMSIGEHLATFSNAAFRDVQFIQNLKGLAVFKAQP